MQNTSQKKVVKKGYTISVTSWENDADNYQTHEFNTKDIIEVMAVVRLAKLHTSYHSSDGVGNSSCSSVVPDRIINFMKENLILMKKSGIALENCSEEDRNEIMIETFNEISWEIMGSSEDYDYRVYSKHDVIFSKEDIFVDKIDM